MFKAINRFHLGIYLISLYLFVFLACPVNAQQTAEVPPACAELQLDKLDNFFIIDKLRVDLLKEIPLLNARKKEIEEIKLPLVTKIESDITDAKAKLKTLEDQGNLTGDKLTQANELKDSIAKLQSSLGGKSVIIYQAELKKIDDDLSWKRVQATCVDTKINKFSETPEQGFKRYMSVFFAALIGIVIIGFFFVSYVDAGVRRSIFGGQAGLQFVTLFSIVIAIILFGITNILEGRELAALLGGLSGYILGKYNSQGGENTAFLNNTVASINITPATATLSTANPTQQLTATAMNAQNHPITLISFRPQWSSSNTLVATVDQTGLVTRIGAGNCNITATFNGVVSSNCVVTV